MKDVRLILGLVVFLLFTAGTAGASVIKLAGTKWDFPGEAGENAPFVQFRQDGKVVGSTGCNRFTGTYSQDGAALRIGTLATTRRACLPQVMKREQRVLDALGRTRRGEASYSTLTLKDKDGKVLAELKRRDAG